MSVEREMEAEESVTTSASKRPRCQDDSAKKEAPEETDACGVALKLEPVQYAIRRLVEALTARQESKIWAEATSSGIPLKMDTSDRDWLSFRASYFTRKRKREVNDLKRYGGVENLNKFGKAPEWRAMLKACEECCLGKYNEETSHFTIS
jgi:hypothetical protein